eukprot:CAMPEP_0170190562 /NCGR_PEP_ID=MMETSP0040_2-20121228/49624_1 /TAXON_ID=641309 /ORGANISM="Lotharella oceanica, Strain CCMP622" /LENGTH=142 /DNA_ID=CAMNT_0010438449 /DNA_START=523 /DNA_END=950 /DNA_ORIENTATION=+
MSKALTWASVSRIALWEPLGTVDVLPLVEHCELPAMPTEWRDGEERLHALGDLAAAIRRDRVKQFLQEVRASPPHLVVNRRCADQQAVPALLRLAQAHQPHHIRAVGVEGLRGVRLVDSRVRIVRVSAHVPHMSQDVPRSVL